MKLSEFELQTGLPYHFAVWRRKEEVSWMFGSVPVELLVFDDGPPDEEMAQMAAAGAAFVRKEGAYLSDLIYGHYLYAQRAKWLSFWSVPSGLTKPQVMDFVHSVEIHAGRDRSADPIYDLTIHVNPKWDEEHKLSLALKDGKVVSANDEAFTLRDGILEHG